MDLISTLKANQEQHGIKPTSEPDPTPEPEPTGFDADLVPDMDEVNDRTRESDEIDTLLVGVGIARAYTMWCGKSEVPTTTRTEGLKVSCPNPSHPDRNPSAWLNTEKDTWYCAACDMGGDKFDIAAWHLGYPVPGYKSEFPKLKREMAERLGYTVKRTIGGETYVESTPEIVTEPAPVADDDVEDNVIHITPRPADEDADVIAPPLDWKSIFRDDTFMQRWMQATMHDDLPEEYYFWLGLTIVGLAAGNAATLGDNPEVKGNLFVCLYGSTGIGKSRSTQAAISLLREALPFEPKKKGDVGVLMVPSPGSSEALIDMFAKKFPWSPDDDDIPTEVDEDDDIDPDDVPTGDDGEDQWEYFPVRGLVRFDELSTLISRAERSGNPMKPTLMEFYDSYNPVEHKTRTHGYVRAEEHFAACITTTQPRAIRSLLTQTDADAGFVNRWIFASGTAKTQVSFGRSEMDLSTCVDPLQRINKWGRGIDGKRVVGMTDEALGRWDDFFHDTVVPTKEKDETNLLSRIDLTMKKIILLLAIDRKHKNVTLEDVEDSIKLWDYLTTSYALLADEIGVGVFEDCRRAVGEVARSHHDRTGKHPTNRDILRGINNRFASNLVVKVIETMCTLGELNEYRDTGPDGRSGKTRYAYVF